VLRNPPERRVRNRYVVDSVGEKFPIRHQTNKHGRTVVMTIDDLIPLSGDSTLLAWQYQNDQLMLTLELYDIDATVSIFIKSKWLAINVPIQPNDDIFRTCYIEIVELRHLLAETNGFYVPAKEFGPFMQETRKNLNLAYGLKADKYRYIFSLKNSNPLISCILSDLTQITVLP